jgi:hypothetical protein
MTPEQVEIACLRQQLHEMRRSFLEQFDGLMARIGRLSGPDESPEPKLPQTTERWRGFLDPDRKIFPKKKRKPVKMDKG